MNDGITTGIHDLWPTKLFKKILPDNTDPNAQLKMDIKYCKQLSVFAYGLFKHQILLKTDGCIIQVRSSINMDQRESTAMKGSMATLGWTP